jgi:hypothetical protein
MKVKKIKDSITEAGFYFVKRKDFGYWQCMVRVLGTAPFLSLGNITPLFKTSDDTCLNDLSNVEWSERIEGLEGNEKTLESWQEEFLEVLRGGGKLQAVKIKKDNSGWGLRACKGFADAAQERLRLNLEVQWDLDEAYCDEYCMSRN